MDRERGSPEPRRPVFGRCQPMKVVWHLRAACCEASGVTAEAQAGDPLLRHHYFSGSYVPHGICGRVILVDCATKRKFL